MVDNRQSAATTQKNKATTTNQSSDNTQQNGINKDTNDMDRGDGRQPNQTDMQPTPSTATGSEVDRKSQAEQHQLHANDPGRNPQSTDPSNTTDDTIKAPVDNNQAVADFKSQQRDIIQRIRTDLEELTRHLDTLI